MWWRDVFMAVFFAATLLLAAILQAEAGPIPDGTVLSSRGVTLAAVGAEFLLGAWLLSGIGAARAAIAARWFFTALADWPGCYPSKEREMPSFF